MYLGKKCRLPPGTVLCFPQRSEVVDNTTKTELLQEPEDLLLTPFGGRPLASLLVILLNLLQIREWDEFPLVDRVDKVLFLDSYQRFGNGG